MKEAVQTMDAEASVKVQAARIRELESSNATAFAAVGLQWIDGQQPPSIEKGSEKYFIVAVKRAYNGKTYTLPASYLNHYPLQYEDKCHCDSEEEHEKYDGCPTTGWFTCESSHQYDGSLYMSLLSTKGDELVAWAAIPAFDIAALSPQTGMVMVPQSELDSLKQDVVAFCGPWAVQYAQSSGLPKDHLHPTHYDILEKCGARMDSFTRAATSAKE